MDITTIAKINEYKAQNKKVVFTNGCFDILHVGHVRYLQKAKSFGDILVVGLNSDESVRRLKGEMRPINVEAERAEVLLALKSVDDVIIFSEDTAERLISEILPDFYVKGGDYSLDTLPEAKIVLSYGGKVEIVKFETGHSTTKVLEKIQKG